MCIRDRNYTDTVRTVSPEAKAEAKRLYKEGVKYGLAGLYPQAIEILQRSIQLDPENANAHFALGHAYFDVKQYREAIESLKMAVALDPKDIEARDRLGLARAMLWEQDNAKLTAQRQKAQSRPQPVAEQVSISVKVPTPPEKTLDKAPEKTPETTIETSDEVNAAAKELALTKIYRVGPNDVLDIRINDDASQSTLFTITASGLLEHPMLAEPLPAGGLTTD